MFTTLKDWIECNFFYFRRQKNHTFNFSIRRLTVLRWHLRLTWQQHRVVDADEHWAWQHQANWHQQLIIQRQPQSQVLHADCAHSFSHQLFTILPFLWPAHKCYTIMVMIIMQLPLHRRRWPYRPWYPIWDDPELVPVWSTTAITIVATTWYRRERMAPIWMIHLMACCLVCNCCSCIFIFLCLVTEKLRPYSARQLFWLPVMYCVFFSCS